MSRRALRAAAALAAGLLALGLAPAPAAAAPPGDELPTVAEATAGLERRAGLLDLWLDRTRGRVWLELPAASAADGTVGSYLYVEGLVTGLGSNPIGLDRGQIGETRVVTLRRLGGRLLVEVPNLRFRALSDSADERRAVEESFAPSILWAGDLAALDRDGRALVDFTSFVVRDAHGVAATLVATGQGSYSLDPARSVVDLDACLAFPENLELEARLTFAAADAHAAAGTLVARTAPLADAFTLVQHHSLVALPDDGYEPRPFDPRAGSFAVTFADYAVPLDAPIERSWIVRHRLEKRDPDAPSSPAVEPLVYYVDRGAPEPVRSALVEGASWWAEAFEAAGFEDAFRVELLPEGAHPLDVRYNVIQWVHRSTRGWSYGGGVIDPRTGEMIKGHVSLGSLRVRQDRLIFEGLLGADATGTGAADDPVELALARIRQLSAHEVGHTLGLAHNFAASTYGRASVMDYPAPLVEVGADGELDVSDVYDTGVGAWDVHAIRYAHAEPPPGVDEASWLAALAAEGPARGLLFLTDEDSRAPGSAQPLASLWDNYGDPVTGLERALAVRRLALERFGPGNIAAGRPLGLLEEVLVPIYLYHRYQLDAAAKAVGGLTYSYALRGDPDAAVAPVPAAEQRRALDLILGTLDPAALDLPEPLLEVLLPRPAGYRPTEEVFGGRTDPAFDALGAAATMAEMTVAALTDPTRAARLVDLHRRDPDLPGLGEVLDRLTEAAFAAPDGPRRAELARTVQAVVVRGLIDLAADPSATPAVAARAEAALGGLAGRLEAAGAGAADPEDADAAHAAYLARAVRRFLDRDHGATPPLPEPLPPPPGSPIGASPAGAGTAAACAAWGGGR